MTGTELLIIFGILIAALCFTLVVIKGRLQGMRHEAKRADLIRHLLEKAQEQNEIFDLNAEERPNSKGMAGTLTKILPAMLELEILSYVSRELEGSSVEVYFRALLPEGPAFFKFRAIVQQVRGSYEKSVMERRPDKREPDVYNRAFLLGQNGDTVAYYDKEHLVPFGEYLPEWLNWSFLEALLQGVGVYQTGTAVAPLRHVAQYSLRTAPDGLQDTADGLRPRSGES